MSIRGFSLILYLWPSVAFVYLCLPSVAFISRVCVGLFGIFYLYRDWPLVVLSPYRYAVLYDEYLSKYLVLSM